MNLFKEVADIKTADQLNLPTPEVEYHNIVAQPTEHQQEMVKALSERASLVHSGTVDPSQDNMPQRLEAAKAQLDNLYQQQAAAKEEAGKPFLYEEELRSKNARLVELDTLLNIDGKGQTHAEAVVAKSTRPSVLDNLKRPVQPHSTDKKPKQHEEVR